MKATYDPTAKTHFNGSHRKENSLHKQFAVVIPSAYDPRDAHAIIDLRLYWPGTVCYAALWVNTPNGIHTQGTGKAGGGGYCKASSAAGQAIRNAGFTLEKRIDGVGESAIREALLAMADALGYPDAMLHVAHA